LEARLDLPRGRLEQPGQARERGVEPLLAQSEYEFALSLEQPMERLTFLGLARVTANLAGLPGLFEASTRQVETRFQGPVPSLGVPPAWLAAAFAVGLALGAGLGLSAMLPRGTRPTGRAEPLPPTAEDAFWRRR
ncbi:MAG TPA: hypothetical protein VNX21_03785, partial [Candidatus Thermoplasmatota archaeon]|nr:hypothetical protein [Candidatus Thermoplasmatota archaeon]